MFTSIAHHLLAWRRYTAAVDELSHLSDRELADIGITRSDIDRIASDHAYRSSDDARFAAAAPVSVRWI